MSVASAGQSVGDPPSWPSLRRLWTEVMAGNAFYRRKLGAVSPVDCPDSFTQFTEQVPFTTKDELVADQQQHPPYGSNLTFPLERYTRCHQTSGTQGAPLRWLDTPESWSALTDDWVEVLRAAGVGPGDRILFAFSFGPFLGFWLAFEAGQRVGALCLAGGGMSTALRLRVLRENACTVLCCTPTYALHLAEAAADSGFDLRQSPIRTLVVAGEPGGSLPATRQCLSSAWNGARVFDHHGMTETGPVTYEHPDRPGHLVVLERSFLAEVIDPASGQPVPSGQPGELVLTTLRRTASPLIRYRTGDLVQARRIPPPASSPLLLEGGILGRVDDMVIVRGVNIYPTAVEETVRSIPGSGEYRVTLDQRNPLVELSIEVEASAAVATTLAARLQDALALRIPVIAVPVGTLPRFEHKARRWRRLDR